MSDMEHTHTGDPMSERNPCLWMQNRTDHTAENDRSVLTALLAGREGVFGPDDLRVTQRGAGANMSVDVAAGRAAINGDTSATTQGTYLVWNDDTVNLIIGASDPTNDRWDIVVARVHDGFYIGSDNEWALEVISGTPAASPVIPTVPDSAILLAAVFVAAGASSIVDAAILDGRQRTATVGGTIVCTSTTRPSSPSAGQTIYETNTGHMLVYTSAGWTPVSPGSVGVSYGEFASVVGSNDVTSGSFVGVSMSKTIAPPDWATTLHFRVNMAARVVSGAAIFTLRLTWRGSAIPGTEYSGQNWQDATTNPIHWRGSVAVGGPTSGTFQIQAKRDAGAGAIRQSLSHFIADVWFT